MEKTGSAMRFRIPMIWRRPPAHEPDQCYACVNDIHGTAEEFLLPTLETMEAGETGVSLYQSSNVTGPCNHIEITQNRLDIIVRHLKLSQRQSILLAKELNNSNLLAPDC